MSYVVLDYESFFDRDYSLRKLTPVEYIHDPRFEVMGCAIKRPNEPAYWMDGPALADHLQQIVPGNTIISHNALFDMAILAWHYKIVPTFMVDTLGMARSTVYAFTKGKASLEALAKYFELPEKGAIIKNMSGVRRADMRPEVWKAYTDYACHDAWLCEQIFLRCAKVFPKPEYAVMDMVLRCAIEPQFELDLELLAQHRNDIYQHKWTLLQRCGLSSPIELMSNPKFAQALITFGVIPPTKVSPTTHQQTFAFAKSDPGMIELAEHPNPSVQALVAARVGHKSTLEETRTDKLLRIGRLMPRVPIPLRYGGAHTHRLSGEWGQNPQNWPRYTTRADGTKETGKLRRAHKAPAGHKVVKCDAAQIEARIAAWLVGQWDLCESFAKGEDIYSQFAQEYIYGYPVGKHTPDERFVGKQAILGLGFQAGAAKFVANNAAKSFEILGRSIIIELAMGERIVQGYRKRFPKFPEGWAKLKDLIPRLAAEDSGAMFGPVIFEHQAVLLPNGHRLFYNGLQHGFNDKTGQREWQFTYGAKTKKLFGGKLFENLAQALARIITMDAAIRMRGRYPHIQLAHQVHDDLVYVVPDDLVPEFRQGLKQEMSTAPSWAPGLPLDAEDAAGENYGDAH